MARIWANRLEAGDFSWSQCPASRKPSVIVVLKQDVAESKNSMTAARYEEIVGEPYVA